MEMDPRVRDFSTRHPRAYAAMALLIALGLAYWASGFARKGQNGIVVAVALLSLSLFAGAIGLLYLLFGRKCNEWDLAFLSTFDANNVSWRHTLTFVLVALLAITLSVLIALTLHRGG